MMHTTTFPNTTQFTNNAFNNSINPNTGFPVPNYSQTGYPNYSTGTPFGYWNTPNQPTLTSWFGAQPFGATPSPFGFSPLGNGYSPFTSSFGGTPFGGTFGPSLGSPITSGFGGLPYGYGYSTPVNSYSPSFYGSVPFNTVPFANLNSPFSTPFNTGYNSSFVGGSFVGTPWYTPSSFYGPTVSPFGFTGVAPVTYSTISPFGGTIPQPTTAWTAPQGTQGCYNGQPTPVREAA